MELPQQQPAERAARTLIRWSWRGAAIVLMVVIVKCSLFPGSEFEQRGWVDDVEGSSGTRHAMGERLVQRGTLSGLTRGEVTQMLGDPINHEEFSGWDLVYDLGEARGFILTGRSFLVLRITQGGVVSDYRIMCDG